ncbi:hypothetical protein [Paraburkholderia sp.]|jgi:hypothetical protein|uniref:hypothetical protein n=1 Tax=Paraburkholderia sp. TaxID=1926495 RepID=UPI002F426E99
MRYDMGSTPELTRLLLSAFTEIPQPAIETSLQRYLWRLIRFDYAEHLADALDDVRTGATGDFLYHKASGLIFAHVEYGYHRVLLAHLCALRKTDLSREHVEWSVRRLGYMDPLRQLADDCVLEGDALFRSSLSKRAHITVGRAFKWEPLERAAFGHFEQDLI